MHRRDFLAASLGGLALGFSAEPLFRISLAEWSFHRALFSSAMSHLDFITRARKDYGLDAVEYVNQFFKDKARDAGYLR
ncbi:MAG TPA: sugar phosphate isomerase/epimerase, partial [Vicinamibacteria bacterium]